MNIDSRTQNHSFKIQKKNLTVNVGKKMYIFFSLSIV